MGGAILEWARARGYLATWTGVTAVHAVRTDMERKRQEGCLSERVFEQNLSGFAYLDGNRDAGPRTIVIVSVPRPACTVAFDTGGGRVLEALVPPTYWWYRRTSEEVGRDLARALGCEPSGVEPLSAPLKALAARTGLVKYGLNNIAYAPGFGSYHQLMAYVVYMDVPPAADPEDDRTACMPECESCRACERACPTGAIRRDEFVLDADRCVTLHSEEPSSRAWPEWIPASAHDCLVGCMACQRVCPKNARLLRVEPSGASFDEAETRLVLGEAPATTGPSWDGIREKFEAAGLLGFGEIASRNLKALVAARR